MNDADHPAHIYRSRPGEHNAEQASVRGPLWSVVVFPDRTASIDLYLTDLLIDEEHPISSLSLTRRGDPRGYIDVLCAQYQESMSVPCEVELPSPKTIREALEWCERALIEAGVTEDAAQ